MAASNDDIMRALGRLEEGQRNANESRGVIHQKIDQTNQVVATIADKLQETSFALRVTTDIAVQARDGLNKFVTEFEKEAAPILEGAKTFREESEPILETSRAIQKALMVLIAVFGAGGVSTIGLFTFANNFVRGAVLAWLNGG